MISRNCKRVSLLAKSFDKLLKITFKAELVAFQAIWTTHLWPFSKSKFNLKSDYVNLRCKEIYGGSWAPFPYILKIMFRSRNFRIFYKQTKYENKTKWSQIFFFAKRFLVFAENPSFVSNSLEIHTCARFLYR